MPMNVDELDLSEEIRSALKEQGYVQLHPPQAEAVPKALMGRNLVVAVPTASGKSLIGYITALKIILQEHRKVLYIVPLKALAAEKKEDFDRFSYLGFKTAMSTGDLDSEDRWLNDADVIIATSEKADSLIRHGSGVINDLGLVIADEIHLIHDPTRGPTLEVALTKLKRRNRNMQIIALSATISNADSLAQWLNADLVKMDWRPIPLHEGVYYNREVTFEDGKSIDISGTGDEIWQLISGTINDGGQCIVFVNSRRSTEALAVKYSIEMKKIAGRTLSSEELDTIEGDANSTALGRKLSACVKCGMAFHNAGLTYRQRHYVEENFRSGNIKCIIATPTLAAGINLPARRVIVRDTKRFESNSGNTPISVMEIKQMCGRAGRPGYDPYGESILIAKSYSDYEHLMDDYVMCDSESIMSKLGNEQVLRSHILGLIATGDASSEDEIIGFIRDTFYGNESELYGIESAVENVVKFLADEEMVTRSGDRIHALPFGKRVSDLYIDPKSAVILRNAIGKIKGDVKDFPVLHAVSSTPDVLGLYPRKKDEGILTSLQETWCNDLLVDVPEENDDRYEYFLGNMKTAALIMDWISEIDEDTMTENMGIGPGDIRSRVDMVDWILYAMSEIAVIYKPDVVKKLRPMLVRVRYGVKKELIDLVSFRGVGRTRARILYDNGIRTRNDVIETDFNKLANLPRIGPALVRSMKEQTGTDCSTKFTPDPIDDETELGSSTARDAPKQSKLLDF